MFYRSRDIFCVFGNFIISHVQIEIEPKSVINVVFSDVDFIQDNNNCNNNTIYIVPIKSEDTESLAI